MTLVSFQEALENLQGFFVRREEKMEGQRYIPKEIKYMREDGSTEGYGSTYESVPHGDPRPYIKEEVIVSAITYPNELEDVELAEERALYQYKIG